MLCFEYVWRAMVVYVLSIVEVKIRCMTLGRSFVFKQTKARPAGKLRMSLGNRKRKKKKTIRNPSKKKKNKKRIERKGQNGNTRNNDTNEIL